MHALRLGIPSTSRSLMAASDIPCQADYQDDDQPALVAASTAHSAPQEPPPEYDFVERPSDDFLCPVTLELLQDPRQTACCGHHLSHEAVTRLQRDTNPCPICKEPNLATVVDKFFRRKVNELKVRCPHKASGCEWVGEVGSLDKHEAACPKRPWECAHCQEKGVYEIQEGHMPKCTRYPTPCPNACDVGSVPWCEVDNHVAVCPLQPVACEFSHAGCEVAVPRREMVRHMEEGAQHHLLTATLLNLSLTREMRTETQGKMEAMEGKMATMEQKMDELSGKLQGRMEAVERQMGGKIGEMQQTLEGKMAAIETKMERNKEEIEGKLQKTMGAVEKMEERKAAMEQQVGKKMEGKMEELVGERERMEGRLQGRMKEMERKLEGRMEAMQRKVDGQILQLREQIAKLQEEVACLRVCSMDPLDFTLTGYEPKADNYTGWYSSPFDSPSPGKYKFKLGFLYRADSSNMALLFLEEGENDVRLPWPITVRGRLTLLNQLGDHGHYSKEFIVEISTQNYTQYTISYPFIPPGDLCHNAQRGTQYLKDKKLHFRLYIRVQKSICSV